MTMTDVSPDAIATAAERLRLARESGIACDPIRDLIGSEDDVDAAYEIQQTNTDEATAAGRRVSGRKIGLTAPAVRAQMGVDQPDFGTLFADMAFADGVEIDSERLLQPRVEAEIALVLKRDLDLVTHTVHDIIAATDFALASIEIVDSRIAGWDIKIVDTIADNASSGLYMLGSRPVPLSTFDIRDVPMTLTVDDQPVSTGHGSACLGNPLNAAVWLADVLSQLGTPLLAGDCILTGALGPMAPIAPGQVAVADLGPLGTVTAPFSERSAH